MTPDRIKAAMELAQMAREPHWWKTVSAGQNINALADAVEQLAAEVTCLVLKYDDACIEIQLLRARLLPFGDLEEAMKVDIP